jgi:DNA replication protein DnaC
MTPVCSICHGAGFVRRDLPPGHPDFGRALLCECARTEAAARQQRRMLDMSNLGMLARLTFASFVPEGYGLDPNRQHNLQRAVAAARQYAENPDGWLVLMGGYGCGKTHLAAAIANHRIAAGAQPLFVVVPDLLDHLRATYGPSSEVGYDERFNQVRNAPLLILDDLGTQAATPWAQEKLFQIFNHRYNAQLPTVVTTNQQLEDIDVRVRSRLVDPEISQLVTILAPDFRQSGVDQGQSDLSALSLLGHMTFDAFDLRALEVSDVERERLRQAYNTCRRFSQAPDGWLVLVGDYGVGKTHLAAAIANGYQEAGQHALLIVVPDLLDHLRATYNPQSTVTYDKRFEQIRRAPLLVLDDLGTQSATPWAQEKLFQLFNFRYMARLPTVITLNDIQNVEQRLLERMMEMKAVGLGSMLEIRVPPYRGRGSGGRNGRPLRGGRRRAEHDFDS